jgi:hypothetical protein
LSIRLAALRALNAPRLYNGLQETNFPSQTTSLNDFAALVGDAASNDPGVSVTFSPGGYLTLVGDEITYLSNDWLQSEYALSTAGEYFPPGVWTPFFRVPAIATAFSLTVPIATLEPWHGYVSPLQTGVGGSLASYTTLAAEGPMAALVAPGFMIAADVSTNELLLTRAAQRVFPQATFASAVETDPEEPWRRLVLYVRTGIDDLDVRMGLEEKFYADVVQHESLTAALRDITVMFE